MRPAFTLKVRRPSPSGADRTYSPREGVVPAAAFGAPLSCSVGLSRRRVASSICRHDGSRSLSTTPFQADPAASLRAVMVYLMRCPGCTSAPGLVRFSAAFVTEVFGGILGLGLTTTL